MFQEADNSFVLGAFRVGCAWIGGTNNYSALLYARMSRKIAVAELLLVLFEIFVVIFGSFSPLLLNEHVRRIR